MRELGDVDPAAARELDEILRRGSESALAALGRITQLEGLLDLYVRAGMEPPSGIR